MVDASSQPALNYGMSLSFDKRFIVTSEEEFQMVLSEIEPFLETAQTIRVSAWKVFSIQMRWSDSLTVFNAEEAGPNTNDGQCWCIFQDFVQESSGCLQLFKVLFEIAKNVSRLEIVNTLPSVPWRLHLFPWETTEDGFPPLKEIMTCLAIDGHWKDRLLHLEIAQFVVDEDSFEALVDESYPENLSSLHINNCSSSPEATRIGIATLLSKVVKSLKTCRIWHSLSLGSHNLDLFRVMNSTICHMTNLQHLSLLGRADPQDEVRMEEFVENIVKLKHLKTLCIHSRARRRAEEGRYNLQDKLLKILPRTGISQFEIRSVFKSRLSPQLCPDAIDTLMTYLSDRSNCKLCHISLKLSKPTVRPCPPFVDLLRPYSRMEQQIVSAIETRLSIPKIIMPMKDESSYKDHKFATEMNAFEHAAMINQRMAFILNDFYLPIINLMTNYQGKGGGGGGILPGLWPYILANKSRRKGDNLGGWKFGRFRLAPNIHATILFFLLREKQYMFVNRG